MLFITHEEQSANEQPKSLCRNVISNPTVRTTGSEKVYTSLENTDINKLEYEKMELEKNYRAAFAEIAMLTQFLNNAEEKLTNIKSEFQTCLKNTDDDSVSQNSIKGKENISTLPEKRDNIIIETDKKGNISPVADEKDYIPAVSTKTDSKNITEKGTIFIKKSSMLKKGNKLQNPSSNAFKGIKNDPKICAANKIRSTLMSDRSTKLKLQRRKHFPNSGELNKVGTVRSQSNLPVETIQTSISSDSDKSTNRKFNSPDKQSPREYPILNKQDTFIKPETIIEPLIQKQNENQSPISPPKIEKKSFICECANLNTCKLNHLESNTDQYNTKNNTELKISSAEKSIQVGKDEIKCQFYEQGISVHNKTTEETHPCGKIQENIIFDTENCSPQSMEQNIDSKLNNESTSTKLSKLSVQQMPRIDIRRPLVMQRNPILVINPQEPDMESQNTNNVHYYEFTSKTVSSDACIPQQKTEVLQFTNENLCNVNNPVEEINDDELQCKANAELYNKQTPETTNLPIKLTEDEEIHTTNKTQMVNPELNLLHEDIPSINTLKTIQSYLEKKYAKMNENISGNNQLDSGCRANRQLISGNPSRLSYFQQIKQGQKNKLQSCIENQATSSSMKRCQAHHHIVCNSKSLNRETCRANDINTCKAETTMKCSAEDEEPHNIQKCSAEEPVPGTSKSQDVFQKTSCNANEADTFRSGTCAADEARHRNPKPSYISKQETCAANEAESYLSGKVTFVANEAGASSLKPNYISEEVTFGGNEVEFGVKSSYISEQGICGANEAERSFREKIVIEEKSFSLKPRDLVTYDENEVKPCSLKTSYLGKQTSCVENIAGLSYSKSDYMREEVNSFGNDIESKIPNEQGICSANEATSYSPKPSYINEQLVCAANEARSMNLKASEQLNCFENEERPSCSKLDYKNEQAKSEATFCIAKLSCRSENASFKTCVENETNSSSSRPCNANPINVCSTKTSCINDKSKCIANSQNQGLKKNSSALTKHFPSNERVQSYFQKSTLLLEKMKNLSLSKSGGQHSTCTKNTKVSNLDTNEVLHSCPAENLETCSALCCNTHTLQHQQNVGRSYDLNSDCQSKNNSPEHTPDCNSNKKQINTDETNICKARENCKSDKNRCFCCKCNESGTKICNKDTTIQVVTTIRCEYDEKNTKQNGAVKQITVSHKNQDASTQYTCAANAIEQSDYMENRKMVMHDTLPGEKGSSKQQTDASCQYELTKGETIEMQDDINRVDFTQQNKISEDSNNEFVCAANNEKSFVCAVNNEKSNVLPETVQDSSCRANTNIDFQSELLCVVDFEQANKKAKTTQEPTTSPKYSFPCSSNHSESEKYEENKTQSPREIVKTKVGDAVNFRESENLDEPNNEDIKQCCNEVYDYPCALDQTELYKHKINQLPPKTDELKHKAAANFEHLDETANNEDIQYCNNELCKCPSPLDQTKLYEDKINRLAPKTDKLKLKAAEYELDSDEMTNKENMPSCRNEICVQKKVCEHTIDQPPDEAVDSKGISAANLKFKTTNDEHISQCRNEVCDCPSTFDQADLYKPKINHSPRKLVNTQKYLDESTNNENIPCDCASKNELYKGKKYKKSEFISCKNCKEYKPRDINIQDQNPSDSSDSDSEPLNVYLRRSKFKDMKKNVSFELTANKMKSTASYRKTSYDNVDISLSDQDETNENNYLTHSETSKEVTHQEIDFENEVIYESTNIQTQFDRNRTTTNEYTHEIHLEQARKNVPCYDLYTNNAYPNLNDNRTRIQFKLPSKQRYSSNSSTSISDSIIDDSVDITLSEGEIKYPCKCSTSIGEIHLCKFANSIKRKVNAVKRNPEKMLAEELGARKVYVKGQRKNVYSDNLVTYKYKTNELHSTESDSCYSYSKTTFDSIDS